MEVEVAFTVKQYGRYSRHGSKGNPPAQTAGVLELIKSSFIKGNDHPGKDGNQGQSDLGGEVKVIVVYHSIMPRKTCRLIFCKDGGKGSGACSEQGVVIYHLHNRADKVFQDLLP